jgi:cobyric acid synthase
MNPVLLKPASDSSAQVIVQGQLVADIANMGFADAAGNSSVLQQTWPGVKPGHAQDFFN